MQKPFLHDYWDVKIRGTSVWSYFRFSHNNQPSSQYKPKFKLGIIDIVFFFKLLFLRFSKVETVIFLAARNDLLSLLDSALFSSKNKLVFLREDGHGVAGNVFIIEAIRFLFRSCSPFLFKRDYKSLKAQLKKIDSNLYENEGCIKAAIGDLYFNKLLSFFLKGKKVYFSNCVVPKIERVQYLSNSVEIQHGVIYELHPDYGKVPKELFKVPLLCWGDFWFNRIKAMGFEGDILVGPSPRSKSSTQAYPNSICFFTTVSEHISAKILACIEHTSGLNIFLQPHPRDFYDYKKNKSQFSFEICKGLSPLEVSWPIMHDSTLAYICAQNKKYFIYLAGDDEAESEIVERLLQKYGAEIGRHYSIAFSSSDIVKIVSAH